MGVAITTPGTVEHPDGRSTDLPAIADPDGGDDDRLMRLTEDMGLWDATGPQAALPADPPPGRLGPDFSVVWTLWGPDGEVSLAQSLYPQAQGGPLVHTAPGQVAYDAPVPGGWYRASARLAPTLESLGWATKTTLADGGPKVAPPAAAAVSAAAHEPAPAADPAARRGPRAAAVGVALLTAVGAGVAWRRRRGAAPAAG
jgi:hypothetical protein